MVNPTLEQPMINLSPCLYLHTRSIFWQPTKTQICICKAVANPFNTDTCMPVFLFSLRCVIIISLATILLTRDCGNVPYVQLKLFDRIQSAVNQKWPLHCSRKLCLAMEISLLQSVNISLKLGFHCLWEQINEINFDMVKAVVWMILQDLFYT